MRLRLNIGNYTRHDMTDRWHIVIAIKVPWRAGVLYTSCLHGERVMVSGYCPLSSVLRSISHPHASLYRVSSISLSLSLSHTYTHTHTFSFVLFIWRTLGLYVYFAWSVIAIFASLCRTNYNSNAIYINLSTETTYLKFWSLTTIIQIIIAEWFHH